MRAGREAFDAARRDRLGQDVHHGQRHRGARPAHAGPFAQQDAGRAALQRVQAVLPRERGRIFRLLLRLLPARGLHSAQRHLHREGLERERGDRAAAAFRHQLAPHPARRARRRQRLVHLRPGLARGLQGHDLPGGEGAVPHPRRCSSRGWWRCNTSGTITSSRAANSACAATRWSFARPTPRTRCGSNSSATRSTGSPASIRSAARRSSRWNRSRFSPRGITSRPPTRCASRMGTIRAELDERIAELEKQGKLLEAQRLKMRTTFDLEMMEEMGFCNGIENYSRHTSGRPPGSRPFTLIDFFPKDFLTIIDESHVAVPQIGGMYEGDMLAQDGAGRARLPAALGARQPAAEVRRIRRAGRPAALRLGHARRSTRWRNRAASRRSRSSAPPACSIPEIVVKPLGGQVDDLHRAGAAARREGRAGAGDHADQADGGGPGRLPARSRREGALHPLRNRHDRAGGNPAQPAHGRSRRAHRHQSAARGARPAGSLARRRARRRQGGLSALANVAHPDRGPRRAPPQRPGHSLRRHDHRFDQAAHRREQGAPRKAARLQQGARHHAPLGRARGAGKPRQSSSRAGRSRPTWWARRRRTWT